MLMKEIFDLSKGSLQPWRVDTDYTIGQLVYTGGSIYKALTAHHSATDVFETDADEYWELIVGGSNGGSNIPVGGIVPFSGDRLPTGYLYCRGQEVSRQTYSQLFKVIGTTYGAGDGATTFNIPDLRGRVPVGQAVDITFDNGDNVVYFRSLGERSGSVAEYIQLKHLPAHTHELQDKTHYHDGSNGTDSSQSYTNEEWRQGSSTTHNSHYLPWKIGTFNWDDSDNLSGTSGGSYLKSSNRNESNYGSVVLAHKHYVKGATIKNWRTKHSVLNSDYQVQSQKKYSTLQPYLTVDYIICFRSQIDLSDLTVDEWQPQTQYYEDDIVYYGGKIYKCKPNGDHVSGNILDTAELENWILLSGTDEAFEMAEWEANVDYVVGDLVWHDGTVYRAMAEHTSNTFETEAQTNWDVVIAPHFSSGIKLSASFNTLTPIEDMIAYMKSQEYHVDSTGGVKYLFDVNTSFELSPGRCMKFFCEATYVSEDLVYFEATPQQRFGYTSGDVGVVKYQGVFAQGVFHGWQPIDSIKQWLSHVSYNKDDMVFHDGYLYSRIADGQIEADFDETEWKRYVTSDEIDVTESLKAWQQETEYKVGNLAYINNNLYRVITEHTSTTVFEDDIANWELIVGFDMNQWQPDTSYVVGDLAYNNKILYEVITDHTSTTVFEDDIANWKPIVGIGQQYADEIDNAKISNDTKEYTTLKERLDMTQVHVIDDGHIDTYPALVLPVGTLATFPNTDVEGAIYRCIVESEFGNTAAGTSISQNPVRNPENWELIVGISYQELEKLVKVPSISEWAVMPTVGRVRIKVGDLCYHKQQVWKCRREITIGMSIPVPALTGEGSSYWEPIYGGYLGYMATSESANWYKYDAAGNKPFKDLDDRLNQGLIEQYSKIRNSGTQTSGGSVPKGYSRGDLVQLDGIIYRRRDNGRRTDNPAIDTDSWDEFLINKDLHKSKHGYEYENYYVGYKQNSYDIGYEDDIEDVNSQTYYAVKCRLDAELIEQYRPSSGTFNPDYWENDLVQLGGTLYKRKKRSLNRNELPNMHPLTGADKDEYWDKYILKSDIQDLLDAMDEALTNEHGDTYDTLKERLDIEGIARYTEDNGNVIYNTNDLVHKDGIIYKCLEDNVSGAWDETKWVSYATLDDLQEIVDARTNGHDVEYTTLKERLDLETIELYSTDAIYDVDDLVQLDGVIYKRKTATGTVDGVFNEQQWTRYITDDEIILFEEWQPNTTYEKGTFVYEPSGYITTPMGMFMGTGSTPTWGKNAQEADVVVAPTSDEAVTYKSNINGDIVQMIISDVLNRMPYAIGAKHTYYTRVNIMNEAAVTNNPFAAVNSFGDEFGVFVEVYRNVGAGANFTLFAYADAASKNDTLEYMFYGSYIDPNFDENNPTSDIANFTGWKKVNGVKPYSANKIYQINDMVFKDGKLYSRTVETGTLDVDFDETQWTRYLTEDDMFNPQPWQPNTSYNAGDVYYKNGHLIKTRFNTTTGNEFSWGGDGVNEEVLAAPTSDVPMSNKTGMNGDIIEYLVTDLFTKYPNCRLYRTKHTYSFNVRELAGVVNNPFRTVPMANTDHSLFIEVYKSDTHKLNFYAYADNTSLCESISHIFYGSYIDDTATNAYDPAKFSGWKAIDGVKLYQPNLVYKTNDMVFHDGNLYSRTVQTDVLDVDFDETQWQRFLTEDDLFDPQPWQPNTQYSAGDIVYKDNHLVLMTGNRNDAEFAWGDNWNRKTLIEPSSDEHMTMIDDINGDIVQYLIEDLFDRYSDTYTINSKHTYCFNVLEQAGVTNNPFRTTSIFNTRHSLYIETYRMFKNDTHRINLYAYADSTVECESVSHIFYGSYISDTTTYDGTKFSGWKAVDGIKAYNPNLVYKTNDVVFYDGDLYSRIVQTDVIDGAWDRTQWQRYLTEEEAFTPQPWQPNTTFKAGQPIYKDGFLYAQKFDIGTGAEFSWGIASDTNNYEIYSKPSSDIPLELVGGINGDIVGEVVQDIIDRLPYVDRSKHSYVISVTRMGTVENNPFVTTGQFNESCRMFIDVYRNNKYSMDLYAYATGMSGIDHVHMYHGYYSSTNATYDPNNFSGWQPIDGLKSFEANKVIYTIDDMVTKDGETYKRIVETGAVDTAWDDTQWVRFLTTADNITGAQSDWNETDVTAEAYILNKPEIGDLTTLVTNDKTSIVAAINEAAASGVQPDWEETDNTSFAFIQNKPAIGDINTLLTDDKTDIVTSINEIHEELEDFVLHEDYTGTAAVTTDLSTRVADLEVDTAALMVEIEDARESTDGTAHGNIGQRMDAIEDGYLPLTGGTLTGELKVKTSDGIRMAANNGTSTLIRNDGNHLYILTTDAGDEDGWFNALRPFRINLTNGTVTMEHILEVDTEVKTPFVRTDGNLNITATGGTISTNSPIMFRDKTMYDGGNVTVNSNGNKALTINSYQVGEITLGCMGADCNVTTTVSKFMFNKELWINNGSGTVNIIPQADGCHLSSDQNLFVFHGELRGTRLVNPSGILRIGGSAGSVQCEGTFAPTTNGNYHLGIDGLRWAQVWTTGGLVQGSDENIKEDIRVVSDEDYFEMIRGTEVKSYLYKQSQDGIMVASDRTQETVDNNELSIGVVAQDLANYESSKYVLQEGESGYSINLYNYTASVHSALRHEIALREQLEQENQELKDRLAAIEAHLGL